MTAEDRIAEIRVWTMAILGGLLVLTALLVPFSVIHGQGWIWFFAGVAFAAITVLILFNLSGGRKASVAAWDERAKSFENRGIVLTWHIMMWVLPALVLAQSLHWLTSAHCFAIFAMLTAGLPGVLTFLFERNAG